MAFSSFFDRSSRSRSAWTTTVERYVPRRALLVAIDHAVVEAALAVEVGLLEPALGVEPFGFSFAASAARVSISRMRPARSAGAASVSAAAISASICSICVWYLALLLLELLLLGSLQLVALDLLKLALDLLPGAEMVGHHHPDGREQHRDRRDARRPGAGSVAVDTFPRLPAWSAPVLQILKKYSGIATTYFRLIVQRSTILIGRLAMNRSRTARVMYRDHAGLLDVVLEEEPSTRRSGVTAK